MSSSKIKKLFSFVMIFAVALATGFAIGKIYVDNNSHGAVGSDKVEADYRESDDVVSALALRANGGASVDTFSCLELFQIAEYNLEKSEYFLKEGLGSATSTGVTCDMRIQKIKYGNHYGYYKMSPSKTVPVVGVETPAVCLKTIYNTKTKTAKVSKYKKPKFLDKSLQTMEADFSAKENETNGDKALSFSLDDYVTRFKTTPMRAMAFIMSNKTTTDENFSDLVDNGDGTYSFNINLSAVDNDIMAALYYSLEIQFACGYSHPYWTSALLEVTIDSSFNFKKIHYVEKYIERDKRTVSGDPYIEEYIPGGGLVKEASVINDYTDTFYFDKTEIANKVLSNFKTYEPDLNI